MRQLTFKLKPALHAGLDQFEGGNQVKQAIRDCVARGEPRVLWLWGAAGVGKSHLLQAACNLAGEGISSDSSQKAAYLPLNHEAFDDPAFLQGWGTVDVIAIDDADTKVGDRQWESALFELFNQRLDQNKVLIIATTKPPKTLQFELPDLKSRWMSALIFELAVLDEPSRWQVFQKRARAKDLVLTEDVHNYIERHAPRDLPQLMQLVESLDEASLSAGRKITIPFVREILQSQSINNGQSL